MDSSPVTFLLGKTIQPHNSVDCQELLPDRPGTVLLVGDLAPRTNSLRGGRSVGQPVLLSRKGTRASLQPSALPCLAVQQCQQCQRLQQCTLSSLT